MSENTQNTPKQGTSGQAPVNDSNLDISNILSVVWGLRWWTVIAIAAALVIAFCYIKITRVQYSASATIMVVNRDNIGSAEVAILNEITGMNKVNKAVNEMEMLRSQSLMVRTVEKLGLCYSYVKARRIKPIIYDLGSSPYVCLYDGIENNPDPVGATISFIPRDSASFTLKSINISSVKGEYPFEDKVYAYGEQIPVFDHFFSIELTGIGGLEYGDVYQIEMVPSYQRAKQMRKQLMVDTEGKKELNRSDIISLKFSDILPKRCEFILNSIIDEYNNDARAFRNKATANSITFLDERLADISRDLGRIEGQYQDYRKDNTAIDVIQQSQIAITRGEKYEDQLNEVLLQMELVGIISDYVDHMGSNPTVIPANIGINDTGLNSTITAYNTLVMERNRMASNSSDSNPLVVQADQQIQEYLAGIRTSIKNVKNTNNIQKRNIEDKIKEGRKRMTDIPDQQLALANLERQQKIKEPLYVLLQQKREEAMIALYSVVDQCKVIDSADHTATPTSPNTRQIYLVAFLLGFCVAPGIFFARQFLRITINGKSDITSRSKLPVLATIPKIENADSIIRVNGREPFEEAFRVMRSSFRYSGHRVYQIVSATPHEGKTFISANICAALAHTGKKVLLIGADLRKPRLDRMFSISQRTESLVSYLIKRTDDVRSLVIHDVKGIANLDVILAGSVPPNPSELLESDRMKQFADEVRSWSEYDYIFYDSCPYLPVADAVSVNNFVDANIFVVRAGVCPIKFIGELDDIAKEKLRNVSIVLNAVDIESRSYGYYNGYGYGHYGYGGKSYGYGKGHSYGFGYGYGYGYGYGARRPKSGFDKFRDKLRGRDSSSHKGENRMEGDGNGSVA